MAGSASARSIAARTSPPARCWSTIDNPELLTKLKEAEAARAVAPADLKRIEVGTRAEVVAAAQGGAGRRPRPALTLAQQTYDRTKQLDGARIRLGRRSSTRRRRSLDVARRSSEQAKLAYDEAVAGYTAEERGVAQASVVKADAAIATLQAAGRRS